MELRDAVESVAELRRLVGDVVETVAATSRRLLQQVRVSVSASCPRDADTAALRPRILPALHTAAPTSTRPRHRQPTADKHHTGLTCSAQLSIGPSDVTRSNPTRQLTDPTQPNPLQVGKFRPNSTQVTHPTQ